MRLGVAPQTVLAAYRVGDSPFNVITPLMAYFPLIVVFTQRYKKDAGIGTVVSLMLPYVVILSVAWTLFFVVWYLIGIPLGPGSPVHTWRARRPLSATAAAREPQHITFLVLAAVVVVFVLDRFPVAIVAVGVGAVALGDGRPRPDQALAGFGDPAVLFIAALFVVSESLDATGVTAWAGQHLVARVGESRTRLLVLTLLPGRGADRADQRQRRGRGARCRWSWSPPAAAALAAPAAAAAGVRRARGLAARRCRARRST